MVQMSSDARTLLTLFRKNDTTFGFRTYVRATTQDMFEMGRDYVPNTTDISATHTTDFSCIATPDLSTVLFADRGYQDGVGGAWLFTKKTPTSDYTQQAFLVSPYYGNTSDTAYGIYIGMDDAGTRFGIGDQASDSDVSNGNIYMYSVDAQGVVLVDGPSIGGEGCEGQQLTFVMSGDGNTLIKPCFINEIVYSYSHTDSGWVQNSTFAADNIIGWPDLSTNYDGSLVAIPNQFDDHGIVNMYQWNADLATYEWLVAIAPSVEINGYVSPSAQFGTWVDLRDNGLLAVAATEDTANSDATNTHGYMYVYERSGAAEWTQVGIRFTYPNPDPNVVQTTGTFTTITDDGVWLATGEYGDGDYSAVVWKFAATDSPTASPITTKSPTTHHSFADNVKLNSWYMWCATIGFIYLL
jgi:hypothetical protein